MEIDKIEIIKKHRTNFKLSIIRKLFILAFLVHTLTIPIHGKAIQSSFSEKTSIALFIFYIGLVIAAFFASGVQLGMTMFSKITIAAELVIVSVFGGWYIQQQMNDVKMNENVELSEVLLSVIIVGSVIAIIWLAVVGAFVYSRTNKDNNAELGILNGH